MTAETDALRAALDALPEPVTLWWRDDDAGGDHPRLAEILALAADRCVPVALAVVPAWLEDACAERIRGCAMATVLQHGFAHEDHAVPPAKKIELGGQADRTRLGRNLSDGRQRLAAVFGTRFLPVMVPPWNRIAPDLLAAMPALGFAGVSVFGPRPSRRPAPGLEQANTHLDLVAWREGSRALTLAELAGRLAWLVAHRAEEPIGILSHHRVMDPAAFATLDRLLHLVQDHPRVRLAAAAASFGGTR